MKYKQPVFNLELMKLATYYKQKRDIVKLAPILDPYKYTKFIYRKDWDDGDYPKEIFLDNVVYGGRAFGGEYKPLDLDIERAIPDTYLYQGFINEFHGMQLSYFKMMQNSAHIRLSLDGKNIWEDYSRSLAFNNKTHSFFFHDYDLNKIRDSAEEIKELIESDGSKISRFVGMKFPVQVSNGNDLARWLALPGAQIYYSIQYNGLMSDEAFKIFLNGSKIQSRNLDYIVTASLSGEDDFIKNGLPIIYKQLLISQMHKKRILLKYEDDFFQDKRWEDLIEYLNEYNKADVMRRNKVSKTLFYYTSHILDKQSMYKPRFSRDYIAELFEMVREKNYNVFKMFYESTGGDFV